MPADEDFAGRTPRSPCARRQLSERIVVGDAVAPVLADGAGLRVLAQVRNDAKDLADESVEALRVEAAAVALLA